MINTGWRISAEQQISSIEAGGFNIREEFKKYQARPSGAPLNPCHQAIANMRETATCIYDQYLSEKVITINFLNNSYTIVRFSFLQKKSCW